MYLSYHGTQYPCACSPSTKMVYTGLPDDFPVPVSGIITLCADDGFVLREDDPVDYLRQDFRDGVLILTDEPEPAPSEPHPTGPTAADQLRADVDYIAALTGVEL